MESFDSPYTFSMDNEYKSESNLGSIHQEEETLVASVKEELLTENNMIAEDDDTYSDDLYEDDFSQDAEGSVKIHKEEKESYCYSVTNDTITHDTVTNEHHNNNNNNNNKNNNSKNSKDGEITIEKIQQISDDSKYADQDVVNKHKEGLNAAATFEGIENLFPSTLSSPNRSAAT